MTLRTTSSHTIGMMVMLVAAFHSSAEAVFKPTTYEARRAGSPPTIDGDLSDPVWTSAQVIDKFYVYQSGGTPAASQGAMRVLWDDQYLYLGMAVKDSNILPASVVKGISGRDSSIFEGDVIEMFIREKTTSPKYFEFEWNARGDEFDARFDTVRFGQPGVKWNTDMQSAVKVDGTLDNKTDIDQGYTVEARIPLTSFDPIQVGSAWTFTFARYDFFTKSPSGYRSDLMMTTPGDPTAPNGGVTNGFHTYEIYDRLEFVGVPEPTSGASCLLMLLFCRPRARKP